MVIFRRDFEADINVDTDIRGVDKRDISKLEDSYDNIRAEIQKISEEYTDVIDVSKIDDQLIDALTTAIQEEINKEQAIATRSQTFGEPEYESGIIEDLGQEVDITVSITPKTEQEIALAKINIDKDKFKSESKELIADSIVGLLAEERFDISKLPELPSGISRNVYDLGDHAVLKVLKTTGDEHRIISNVAQQVSEGLHEDFPTVYEKGLDYVVVEKLQIDKERAEKILKPVSEAYSAAIFSSDEPDPVEVLKIVQQEIKKIDEETGSNLSAIFQFPETSVADILEFKAGENIGFRGDVPVIIDPGTVSLADPSKFLDTFAEGREGAKKLAEEIDKRRGELADARRTAMPVEEKQKRVDKMVLNSCRSSCCNIPSIISSLSSMLDSSRNSNRSNSILFRSDTCYISYYISQYTHIVFHYLCHRITD